MYSLIMRVVVTPAVLQDLTQVQEELAERIPGISFSPYREQPDLENCLEFTAAAQVSEEQKEELVRTLNNDFDQDDTMYWAYGFNTKMFDRRIYYLQLEFLKKRLPA